MEMDTMGNGDSVDCHR